MPAAARAPRVMAAQAAGGAPKAAPAPALPPLPAGKPLSAPQVLRFERKGHVATRKLLSPAEAAPYADTLTAALASRRLDAYRHRVAVMCPPDVAARARLDTVEDARRTLREHSADAVGFLQARPARARGLRTCLTPLGDAGVQPAPRKQRRRRRCARARGAKPVSLSCRARYARALTTPRHHARCTRRRSAWPPWRRSCWACRA
jgi:hypothetical protein